MSEQPRRPPDLRLVAPAAAAWAAVAIGSRILLSTALSVAGALACVAVLFALRRTTAARIACVATLAAAAGLSVAALRAPSSSPVLRDVARRHTSVTADVVATGDPQLFQSRTRTGHFLGALVAIPASLREVRIGVRAVRLRTPIVLLAHGDVWQRLLPSQHVTLAGFLLPAQKGDTVAFAFSARGPPESVGAPSLVQRVAGRVRAGLRESATVLPTDERGLLPGLVDGDVSALPERVRTDFRTTGLTHLVAVSGYNVG
jgi:competence protein ComEC